MDFCYNKSYSIIVRGDGMESYVLNDAEYDFKPLEILSLIQIIKLMKRSWKKV